MIKFKSYVLALLSLLVVVFPGCKDDNEVKVDYNLVAENMVEVEGVPLAEVVVDNDLKTIDLQIPFIQVAQLANLTVNFVNLPTGASVDPNILEADFSNKNRYDVVFTFADGAKKKYSVGAGAASPDPVFTSFELDGVPVAPKKGSFTANLKASSTLSALGVKFTVSPEGTVVKIKQGSDYVVVNTEAVYDFSDKLNGVTFRLVYTSEGTEFSNDVQVKVNTSGYARLEKVWQDFANSLTVTPTWYGIDPVPASPGNDAWDRNIAMDDNYIYFARGNKGATTGLYGILARRLSDGTTKFLSKEGMYADGETGLGAHGTTDVAVIGGKIVACNLANAANNNLKVFVWDNVDAKPRVALTYNVGASPNPRLGDKFSFTGDMNNGKLFFFDYNGSNNRYFVFSMSNGEINPSPEIVTVEDLVTVAGGNTAATVQPFSETEWLFSGTGKQAVVYNPINKAVVYKTSSSVYPTSQVGDAFFSYNDRKYLAFVMSGKSFKQWNLRIISLEYPTLAESLEKWNGKADQYNLSDPNADVEGNVSNGNATGKVIVHKTASGKVYVCALASNQGVALYELKAE